MQEQLIARLYNYIRDNNPDVLFSLQQEGRVTAYLQEKFDTVADLILSMQAAATPPYIIEEHCLKMLIEDLRPSRFNYLSRILEEVFEKDYLRLKANGTLTYEIINMIQETAPVFEEAGFCEENEDDRMLYYHIIGVVDEYLISQR